MDAESICIGCTCNFASSFCTILRASLWMNACHAGGHMSPALVCGGCCLFCTNGAIMVRSSAPTALIYDNSVSMEHLRRHLESSPHYPNTEFKYLGSSGIRHTISLCVCVMSVPRFFLAQDCCLHLSVLKPSATVRTCMVG